MLSNKRNIAHQTAGVPFVTPCTSKQADPVASQKESMIQMEMNVSELFLDEFLPKTKDSMEDTEHNGELRLPQTKLVI